MPQLSLYLDDITMSNVRQNAARANSSLSTYVRDVLREQDKTDKTSLWPKGFFNLYGACDDETFVEPPEIPWELDGPRKEL